MNSERFQSQKRIIMITKIVNLGSKISIHPCTKHIIRLNFKLNLNIYCLFKSLQQFLSRCETKNVLNLRSLMLQLHFLGRRYFSSSTLVIQFMFSIKHVNLFISNMAKRGRNYLHNLPRYRVYQQIQCVNETTSKGKWFYSLN